MTDRSATQNPNNVSRLLNHLEENSLAARLVKASLADSPTKADATMKTIIESRLTQARKDLDET